MTTDFNREPASGEVTELLRDWYEGNDVALVKVIPLVYQELRRAARYYLGGKRDSHTLQPTALVHEVYLRLMGNKPLEFKDRAHFFRCACLMRRQILLRYAQGRLPRKQRADRDLQSAMDKVLNASGELGLEPATILALDRALHRLKVIDPRKCHVVEIRFLVGMTIQETARALQLSPETARALQLSPETVRRNWHAAKGWLAKAMSENT